MQVRKEISTISTVRNEHCGWEATLATQDAWARENDADVDAAGANARRVLGKWEI